jgi:hypothetical protein
MQKDLRKLLGVGTLGAMMAFAAPAVADMYNDWDTNDEVGIDLTEWEEGFDGIYDSWDADDDGALSEDEFNTGAYDAYDQNDDGLLDENEFSTYEEEDQGFWDI